jgi:hypothetical protein
MYIYVTTNNFQNVNIEEVNIKYCNPSSFNRFGYTYWSLDIQINKDEYKWVYVL